MTDLNNLKNISCLQQTHHCSDFSCLPKVSLTTVSELYNGDDHTVNPHGFQRNVKEKENAIETKVGAHC